MTASSISNSHSAQLRNNFYYAVFGFVPSSILPTIISGILVPGTALQAHPSRRHGLFVCLEALLFEMLLDLSD